MIYTPIEGDGFRKLPKYSSYKNSMFNKKKEKMRHLINSIKETSIKQEDKIKLLNELKQML